MIVLRDTSRLQKSAPAERFLLRRKEDLPNQALVPTPGTVNRDGNATQSGAAHR